MRKIKLLDIVLAGCLVLAASCVSVGGPADATKDEKTVAKGVKAWNDKGPEAAKPIWKGIEDQATRDTYAGYSGSYDTGAKALDASLTLKPTETARIAAEYDKAYKALSSLPPELAVPASDKVRALALAEIKVRSLLGEGEYQAALTAGNNATKVFGSSDAIKAMTVECDVILASQKREAGADSGYGSAKAVEAFDDKVAALDAAAAGYSKAEAALANDASKAGLSKAKSVSVASSRLKRKRQDVEIQKEKAIRERAYYYRDRIGEEFAKPAVGKKPGSLTLEELLRHQESVKAGVQAVYVEMKAFSERYTQALDAETMQELEDQKRELDAKIALVVAEIKTAKEIESRGRVVMPVMIGLFNPQPGTKDEGKKSRPALFSATGQKKAEYWWGMVSIPKGTMSDLVFTVSDTRPVRVFAYNTKSGKLVGDKGVEDLVNRGYRSGNSWPVLNAGSQLVSDKYFFEIQPGKTAEYSGEVVVYSSFITRMR